MKYALVACLILILFAAIFYYYFISKQEVQQEEQTQHTNFKSIILAKKNKDYEALNKAMKPILDKFSDPDYKNLYEYDLIANVAQFYERNQQLDLAISYYSTLGRIASTNVDTKEALKIFNKVLLLNNNQNLLIDCITKHNIAQMYFLNKNYKKATNAYIASLNICLSNKNFYYAKMNIEYLWSLLMKLELYDKALEIALISLEINIEQNNKVMIIDDYLKLAEIYAYQNDKENRCNSLLAAQKTIKSLNNKQYNTLVDEALQKCN